MRKKDKYIEKLEREKEELINKLESKDQK